MIFVTTNAIADIISGKKVQTRRLVKEDEFLFDYIEDSKRDFWLSEDGEKLEKIEGVLKSKNNINRIKWKVGRTYAVQSGRGKPCALACLIDHEHSMTELLEHCDIKPLRIRITSIRKERLNDISDKDIKSEGFSSRFEFRCAFFKVNIGNVPSNIETPENKISEGVYGWDPALWVLEFKVV